MKRLLDIKFRADINYTCYVNAGIQIFSSLKKRAMFIQDFALCVLKELASVTILLLLKVFVFEALPSLALFYPRLNYRHLKS